MKPFLSTSARRRLMALVLAAGAVALPPHAPLPAAAAPQAVIVVNTADDEDIANGACSLREAIIAADTNLAYKGCVAGSAVTTDTISFAASVVQINLGAELPEINNRVHINGFSAAGNYVRLNAAALAAGADVFQIDGDGVSISSFQIYNLAPGSGRAIYVEDGDGTSIYFNYIGLTSTANSCDGAVVTRASQYGVRLDQASGGAYVFGNVFGCSTTAAILINGSGGNRIGDGVGNQIGVSGNVAMPNGIGVWLNNDGATGASNNIIRDNTISGNAGDGVRISGTGANDATSSYGNVVAGNIIGLKANGIDKLANAGNGVNIVDGAYLNRIGGAADDDRNVISGNGGHGVRIADSDSNNVLGNTIGLSSASDAVKGNAMSGVLIINGVRNNLGCTSVCGARRGNRIGGNYRGVHLIGARQTLIAANSIGVAPGGLFGNDVGNYDGGILLKDGTQQTTIGSGSDESWANTISFNGGSGVRVEGGTSTTNTVGINTIYANKMHGVAFADGAHANALKGTTIVLNGDGPFGRYDGIHQAAPGLANRWSQLSMSSNKGLGIDVLAASESTNVNNNPGVAFTETRKIGPNISIKGRVKATTFVGVREIEIYEVSPNASNFGEGFVYVGKDTLNAQGEFSLSVAGDTVKCYTAVVHYLPSNTADDYSTEFSRNSCAGAKLPMVLR